MSFDVDGALPDAARRAIEQLAAGREVTAVEPMPGHAGFSYGVRVARDAFVLRIPPPGARPDGPADVLAQARLLEWLAGTQVPVARVRGRGAATDPWFAVDRLPGATIRPSDARAAPFDAGQTHRLGLAAIDALRALHAVAPPPWLGEARSARESVTQWDRFAERAADPALLAQAGRLRDRLLDAAPEAPALGIVHGDYQWGNLLAGDSGGDVELVAILDWELAHVGCVLDDLGWLCLFSDPAWWTGDAMRIPDGIPDASALAARYGAPEHEVRWHTARAAYAFGVVIALNLALHRRGKRIDPYWELLAPSAPTMIARALESLM
jgi:aminoglycoside phosphotransferase (APT) family kinase protein